MEPPTPLRNDDFRRMLQAGPRTAATPSGALGGATPAASASASGDSFAKPAALSKDDKKKREKATRWRAIIEARVEEQKQHDQKYRDRAKERRNDVNPDYAADAAVAENVRRGSMQTQCAATLCIYFFSIC